MEVGGFTLCAINCHLPSGEGAEAIEARKASVLQILAGLESVEEYDFLLFMGDMNVRLFPLVPAPTITQKVTERDYKVLIQQDDLARVLRPQTPLGAFAEAAIEFPPTYKYLTAKELSQPLDQQPEQLAISVKNPAIFDELNDFENCNTSDVDSGQKATKDGLMVNPPVSESVGRPAVGGASKKTFLAPGKQPY